MARSASKATKSPSQGSQTKVVKSKAADVKSSAEEGETPATAGSKGRGRPKGKGKNGAGRQSGSKSIAKLLEKQGIPNFSVRWQKQFALSSFSDFWSPSNTGLHPPRAEGGLPQMPHQQDEHEHHEQVRLVFLPFAFAIFSSKPRRALPCAFFCLYFSLASILCMAPTLYSASSTTCSGESQRRLRFVSEETTKRRLTHAHCSQPCA